MTDGEKRGRDTRERILAAAREQFAAKGFEGATIAEIAGRAGISEGAIYRHFESKDDLLMGCLEPVFDYIGEMVQEGIPTDQELEEVVREGLRRRMEMFERYHDEFKILFGELPHSAPLARMYFNTLRKQRVDLEEMYEWFFARETVRRPALRACFPILLGQVMGLWGVQSMLRLLEDEDLDVPAEGFGISREHLLDDLTEFLMYGFAGVPEDEGSV